MATSARRIVSSRSIFEGLVTRRPSSWDSMSPRVVGPVVMGELLRLPQVIVPWDSRPTDLVASKFPGRSGQGVAVRLGAEEGQVEYYYVDTEGLDSAHLCFRFEPRPSP